MHSYSERHLDPAEARAYRQKHSRSMVRRLSHRREHKLLLRALDEARRACPAAPHVLDYPCGAGRFSGDLAQFAARLTLADHSPAMLELARNALGAPGACHVDEYVGDARAMDLPEGHVDLACCMRLIHHFRDPEDRQRILRGFRRVCRGPLVLSYLAADAPKQWMHERRCQLARIPNRRAILTRAALAHEAELAGYRVVRVWQLSGWFSGQSIALLRPAARRQ